MFTNINWFRIETVCKDQEIVLPKYEFVLENIDEGSDEIVLYHIGEDGSRYNRQIVAHIIAVDIMSCRGEGFEATVKNLDHVIRKEYESWNELPSGRFTVIIDAITVAECLKAYYID